MKRAALLLGVFVAASPAVAHAAYAPRLEVGAEPAAPSAPAALTITVRQAAGEDASRTQVVRYPRELRFNPAFEVMGCTLAQEDAEACPDTSRVGTAAAETELGSFSGDVYLTEDFRSVIFLRGFAGLVRSKVVGTTRVTEDGSVETVLEGLPNVRTTFAQVRLEAGPRSLILLPRRCGAYPVRGRFTSHGGEVAVPDSEIRVDGCDSEPRIASLRTRRKRRSVLVGWNLTAPGSVRVVLERRIRARPWQRWRRLGSAGAGVPAGRVRVRAGRRLRRGVYRVTATALSSGGREADIRRTAFRVRR